MVIAMDPKDPQVGRVGQARGVKVPAGPDPEVRPLRRRHFSASYKQRILAEAERCAPGEVGALLRREGLYSSHLASWRRLAATGALATRRGPESTAGALENALARLSKVEQENRKLRQRLERADAIIAVQKKLSALLQIEIPDNEN